MNLLQGKWPRLATLLAVLVAAALVFLAWERYTRTPWTRDARVRADVVTLSADVSGLITRLPLSDNQQALVMEVTRMPLQSGQAVNLEKVLGHMRKLVQIEFLRNGLQTACTSPQPSTTGGLAALETTCTIRQRGAVVMKQTLLAAAGKTSAYSLSYAGLAEAYDASQAEIRAVRESLRFE